MTSPGRGHNSGTVTATKSRSEAAFVREAKVVPGGSMRAASWFKPHPPYAARGEGCWVVDIDGRRILDCANNFFSLIHGHAFPPVLAAVQQAVDGWLALHPDRSAGVPLFVGVRGGRLNAAVA